MHRKIISFSYLLFVLIVFCKQPQKVIPAKPDAAHVFSRETIEGFCQRDEGISEAAPEYKYDPKSGATGIRFQSVHSSSVLHAMGVRGQDILRAVDHVSIKYPESSDRFSSPFLITEWIHLSGFCSGKIALLTVERGGSILHLRTSAARNQTGSEFTISSEFSESDDKADYIIIEPATNSNPINPQTGYRYTDSQMIQFESMQKKFPNNTLIPRRLTAKEQMDQAALTARIKDITERILTCSVTASEINLVYSNRKRRLEDRLELLQYVIDKMGDNMAGNMRKRYEDVKKSIKEEMQLIQKEEEDIQSRCSTDRQMIK